MLETFGYTERYNPDDECDGVRLRTRDLVTLASIPRPSLCPGCLRSLARNGRTEKDGVYYCASCVRIVNRDPTKDLHAMKNGRSERLLQEGAEDDTTWKADAECWDAPSVLFDTRDLGNGLVDEDIKIAAELWCARCPVRRRCAAVADAKRYVGLWGGAWRSATTSEPKDYRVRYLISPDDTEEVA